jgi:hypothetical protein
LLFANGLGVWKRRTSVDGCSANYCLFLCSNYLFSCNSIYIFL